MSAPPPREAANLLPQTIDELREKDASMEALCDAFTELLIALDAPLDIAISSLATMLARVVMIHDPSDNFAHKTASLRGVAAAIVAYCDASDHASGCDAMVAAADIANRAAFERIDVDIATTTAPRN